jgi:putative CocE/NonD family hydrolase
LNPIEKAFELYFAWRYRLPPRLNSARHHRSIAVEMPDGVVLMTDHFEPLSKGPHPTLLMRLPYGRQGFRNIAAAYAERGFHVVVQACRGTEKSGGRFNPLVNERDDGLATLNWLTQQPWFDGRLGLTGPSYLGYAQWAISDAPGIGALSVKVSSAEFRSVAFPSGAFHLGLWLSWLQTIEGLRGYALYVFHRMVTGDFEQRTAKASMTLPLIEADITAVGHKVWFWRHWFEHAIDDGPFWQEIDHRHRLGGNTPPVHLMSGWYDFMIDQLLRDYEALATAGRGPHLTISSTTHITGGHEADNPVETLNWMRAHLLGERHLLREKPVRIEISGTGSWHEFDAFPPGPADDRIWHLHPNGVMSPRPVKSSEPDRYRYDPADPTPNLGGAIFAFTGAGPVDQGTLEARQDVLTFTSEPLTVPITVIGNVRATLYARASLPEADFFLRLCDVDPSGRSINICDGFIRMTSGDPPMPDDIMKFAFKLHATAHCFKAGHSLRLQVSSGAHPRYARNNGTHEPLGTATTLLPADIEIFHDPERPTAITLPVYEV